MNPLLLLALIPPLLFNLTGLIDTVLTKQFATDQQEGTLHNGTGTLMIIGGVIALVVAIALFPFVYEDLSVGSGIIFLVLSGVLYGLASYPYFKAFESEKVENIIPMLQIMPAMTYMFGVILLGEILSRHIVFIIVAIIIASGLFAWDFETKKLNTQGLLYTFASATIYAFASVLFKLGGGDGLSIWTAFFWQHVGVALACLLRSLDAKTTRTTIQYFKQGGVFFAGLNIINELLYIGGVMILGYLFLKFPVALIETVSKGIQPLLGFGMAWVARKFLPRYFDREYTNTQVSRKIILCIVVVGLIGVLLFGAV